MWHCVWEKSGFYLPSCKTNPVWVGKNDPCFQGVVRKSVRKNQSLSLFIWIWCDNKILIEDNNIYLNLPSKIVALFYNFRNSKN